MTSTDRRIRAIQRAINRSGEPLRFKDIEAIAATQLLRLGFAGQLNGIEGLYIELVEDDEDDDSVHPQILGALLVRYQNLPDGCKLPFARAWRELPEDAYRD